jgi:hypothetical protein
MQSGAAPEAVGHSTESFAGVPLMQLAAVAAARAEGFPIEEVLDAEGLEPAAYRAADIAYKIRLANAAEREQLAEAYKAELARAEDRLSRDVSPLDDDVDAWVRFLGTYSAQSAPTDWLAAIGLSLPDLSRLARIWGRRLESDESLRKRIEKAARDKKPYDVSSLKVSPPKLVPSPVARPIVKPAFADAAPLQSPKPNPVRRWMPRVGPLPETSATAIAPEVSLPRVVPLAIPVRPAGASLLATTSPVFSVPTEDVLPFVDGPEMPVENSPPPAQQVSAPPREALSGTSLSLDIPRGPATPFEAPEAPAPIPKKTKVKPAPAALSGTSLAVDVPQGPVTPFVAAKESPQREEKPVASRLPKVKRAPAALGGTSLAVDIPRGPATPFESTKESRQLDETLVASELPPVKRPPVELGGTSLAVDIPRGPAMPFAPATDPETMVEKPAPPKKPVVKRAPAELSGTSFAVDIPRGPVTPFVGTKEPSAPAPPAAAKEPPPARQPAATPEAGPKPLISLEQHAALTVEIATYPAHAMAILKRYGITPPQKVQLDQHYKGIVAADPAKQSAWHAAYNAHYATLMRMPRR